MIILGTLLDWAMLTLSLFDTMLLLWLGGTVVLNAERRTWGLVLTGGGLLLGAAFFVSHTAILGGYIGLWWNSLWYLGWAPVLGAPFAWYLAMLWYAGFWSDRTTAIYRRHRILLPVTTALVLALSVSLALTLVPAYGD